MESHKIHVPNHQPDIHIITDYIRIPIIFPLYSHYIPIIFPLYPYHTHMLIPNIYEKSKWSLHSGTLIPSSPNGSTDKPQRSCSPVPPARGGSPTARPSREAGAKIHSASLEVNLLLNYWCVLRRVAGWVEMGVAGIMKLLVMTGIIPENSLRLAPVSTN